MNILITNDDGYLAKGIKTLADILEKYGKITVVAPKYHQSGMSTAVSMGLKRVVYKHLDSFHPGQYWSYLDATPASCVKYALDNIFCDNSKPDVVVCGINHGSNASTASCYSGTLGAAAEAALKGIPAIGVSLDDMALEPDFSVVEYFFPEIFEKIMAEPPTKYGVFYNINFPKRKVEEIKGIRVARQGRGKWEKEFQDWNPRIYEHLGVSPEILGQKNDEKIEEGEKPYMMVGHFVDDPTNDPQIADHLLNEQSYITIVSHNTDNTDLQENQRLLDIGFDKNF